MNQINCYLCGSKDYIYRKGKVRDNENLKVLECTNCRLVFLSSFDHINEKFYEQSGMHNQKDVDSWIKSTRADDKRRYDYLKDDICGKKLLDIGCGNGGFLLFSKGICEEVQGVELDQLAKEYFQENQLKVHSNLASVEDKFDVITLFHVLEHIKDPVAFLKEVKSFLNPDGKIYIEVPNADDALLTIYKSTGFSEFTYWSCHLYLFNWNTLKQLFDKAEYNLIYIKGIQRYPITNHLYWLTKSNSDGHKKLGFETTSEFNQEYEKLLEYLDATDTLLACLSNDRCSNT